MDNDRHEGEFQDCGVDHGGLLKGQHVHFSICGRLLLTRARSKQRLFKEGERGGSALRPIEHDIKSRVSR